MNVLLVANGYPSSAFGGVEVYTQAIAQSLAERGHQVTVFCRESHPPSQDYELLESVQAGVRVVRVVNDFKHIHAFEETYSCLPIEALFRQLLAEVTPDLVHFNHLIGLSVGLPEVAWVAGIPQMTTLHDFWHVCARVNLQDWRGRPCGGPLQGGDCYRCVTGSARAFRLRARVLSLGKSVMGLSLRRRFRRWGWLPSASSVTASTGTRQDFDLRRRRFALALSRSSILLTPSRFVANVYRANGLKAVPMKVLPLGVPRGRRDGQRVGFPDSIHVGYIGPLIPSKGFDILLDAFERLQDPRFRLLVFGRDDADPNYTRRIQRRAKRDQRIMFKGPFQPVDREQIYSQLDLVAIPSRVPETFSLVAREALLSGKPVFASNIGALPEVIWSGVNGVLFAPGNSGALSTHLDHIAQDPEWLHRFEAPGTVETHSVQEHVDALLEFYRMTLGGGQAA